MSQTMWRHTLPERAGSIARSWRDVPVSSERLDERRIIIWADDKPALFYIQDRDPKVPGVWFEPVA